MIITYGADYYYCDSQLYDFSIEGNYDYWDNLHTIDEVWTFKEHLDFVEAIEKERAVHREQRKLQIDRIAESGAIKKVSIQEINKFFEDYNLTGIERNNFWRTFNKTYYSKYKKFPTF